MFKWFERRVYVVTFERGRDFDVFDQGILGVYGSDRAAYEAISNEVIAKGYPAGSMSTKGGEFFVTTDDLDHIIEFVIHKKKVL